MVTSSPCELRGMKQILHVDSLFLVNMLATALLYVMATDLMPLTGLKVTYALVVSRDQKMWSYLPLRRMSLVQPIRHTHTFHVRNALSCR